MLLFLTWCITAGWRDANKWSWLVDGSIKFFLFSTIFPWMLLLIIAILLVFGIHKRIPRINWPFTVSFHCKFKIVCKTVLFLFLKNRTILKVKLQKKNHQEWVNKNAVTEYCLIGKNDILLGLFWSGCNTAQKTNFSSKDFFRNCDQICRKLRIWPHLLKKYLMENFIFCAVQTEKYVVITAG